MPGLMDFQTGSLTLQQDFGRLQLSASATANKYWMPMQSTLYTQYSFGGSAAYSISEAVTLHAYGQYYANNREAVTLHAYGQYYANNPIVGPAFSPYVSTTTYGGYADVRINDYFGSNVGVRRYINPMLGQWTTSPIVTPYFRVGKRNKVEHPKKK